MESIKCKGLTFSYPKTEYPVLNNLDLSIKKGELCLLIGESAVGKSTILKLLKKEIAPFGTISGSIEINGTIGYVAQNVDESIVSDKVRSELSFGLTNMGKSSEEIELLVAEIASYFNLESKLDMDIASLSGGEKQILNLASVMIMRPDILLLDEPTSQLDPISADRFINMIMRLHNDFGTTIFMSEHNLEQIIYNADSIAFMRKNLPIIKGDTFDIIHSIKNSNMADCLPAKLRYDIDNIAIRNENEGDEKPKIAMQLKNLYFAYNRGEDVLNNLSLNIFNGKINAIVGPNSSGKSTMLKVASGVKKQYRGKVKTSQKVSYLCQNVTDLFTKERTSDEVEFGEITAFLGIDDIANQHPFDLSGGQAQRLAIAKVLQAGADIILFDEPTKGFDPVSKSKFASIINDLCENGKTVVIVSHDIEFVGEYADYVSFLSRGSIVATRPRREFFSSLGFYTTQLSRLTDGKAVSSRDFGGSV